MRTDDFNFPLSDALIAHEPSERRDQSRLLVLRRRDGLIEHRSFTDLLEYLNPGDALVLNNSRVVPARLRGFKPGSGGRVELLLLAEEHTNDWWAMVRPGKRVRPGNKIKLYDNQGRETQVEAMVGEKNAEGHCRLRFTGTTNLAAALSFLGEVPLPPYIVRSRGATFVEDRERYQTVYADPPGSVAAPTAGLHFTDELIEEIKRRGVRVCFITLHVGLGTFAPVKASAIEKHSMHEERFELGRSTARTINETKENQHRIFAVGTTTVRVLETVAAQNDGRLKATVGRTRIFLYPPADFKIVDGLVTNFHLPRSTLLMLVSAFAAPGETRGRELILAAYTEAIRKGYRFFSYGDAMLIV